MSDERDMLIEQGDSGEVNPVQAAQPDSAQPAVQSPDVAGAGSDTVPAPQSPVPGSAPAKNRFSRNATTNAARISISAATGSKTYRDRATSSGQDDTEGARKGALFLGAVIVAYIIYLVVSGQMASFMNALRNVDMAWVFGAGICFVFYFIFGVGAYMIAVWLDPDSPVGIRDLISVEASGIFFGNLTPMMAGAIPSQILRLTRTGLDAGEAMATQFTRFIVFQAAVVLFAGIMLLFEFPFFLSTYGDIVYLNLVVFGVHALQLVALFVICLCPNFVIRIGNWLIKFLTKRGWMKDYAKWNDMVNNQVAEFSDAFKRAAAHVPSMLLTLAVTMAQLACMYMIPWFVLHAFGKTGNFFTCLAAGSMVQMVASAVPLPGGTGGAEGGFALFYGPMFGSSITAGYLVWRLITFILPTILAAPLLGLRSTSKESIYQRWNNFAHGAGRFKREYRSK